MTDLNACPQKHRGFAKRAAPTSRLFYLRATTNRISPSKHTESTICSLLAGGRPTAAAFYWKPARFTMGTSYGTLDQEWQQLA